MLGEPYIWMPVYIGDYLADTIGLTDEEHGRYYLAWMCYWRCGGPVTDDEMRAILKDSSEKLRRYFTIEDGFWHH